MIDSCVSLVTFNGYRKPTRHDWQALRPEIAKLIAEEWGQLRLAKKYGMTQRGMAQVLQRLGLRTVHQIRAAEQAAAVAAHLAALKRPTT
jgi:hypothetical protein